eukprot:scaffold269390_cov39-Tisochrysis_lutea.AAC.1
MGRRGLEGAPLEGPGRGGRSGETSRLNTGPSMTTARGRTGNNRWNGAGAACYTSRTLLSQHPSTTWLGSSQPLTYPALKVVGFARL